MVVYILVSKHWMLQLHRATSLILFTRRLSQERVLLPPEYLGFVVVELELIKVLSNPITVEEQSSCRGETEIIQRSHRTDSVT